MTNLTQTNGRMTKKELFHNMMTNVSNANRYEREILKDIVSYNDLKNALQSDANFYNCILRQIHKHTQWCGGNAFSYRKHDVDSYIAALHSIAAQVGCELYSPNGAWFVRNISK